MTLTLPFKIVLGFIGACIPKFIEMYYNGKLISMEKRKKKNPKINNKFNFILEVIYIIIGTGFAVYFGTTEVNTITTAMGWEAIVMAFSRGEKK